MFRNIFIVMLTIACTYPLSGQELEAYYSFDGHSEDSSSSMNHLSKIDLTKNQTSVINTVGFTNTIGDSAVSFWSSESFVSQQTDNIGWNSMAISFWLKEASTGQIIQGAYIGFGVDIGYNGLGEKAVLNCFFDGSSVGQLTLSNSAPNLETNTWHHFVCQNDGATTSIYIDGVLDTSHAENYYTMTSTNTLAKYYIGNNIGGSKGGQFTLDELKIFNGSLSSSQISDLYNNNLVTHIKDEIIQAEIHISPNPTFDKVSIQTEKTLSSLTLYDMKGNVKISLSGHQQAFDISTLPSGIYFLKIEVNDTVITKKIIKQ